MKLNLLPPDERPLEPSAIRSEFVIIVVGIILLLAASGFSVLEVLKLDRLRAEQRNLERSVEFLKGQWQEVADLEALVKEMDQAEQGYQALVEGASGIPSDLGAVVTGIPKRLYLEQVKVNEGKVQIDGYAEELGALSLYMSALSRAELFGLIDKLQRHESSGFIQFSISIKEGM